MAIRRRTVTAALAVTALTAPVTLAATAPASARPVAAPHPVAASRLSASERAAVARATPRPPRVTNLAPYKDGSTVTLGWHNPDAALFRRVVVRYARGASAPRSPRSGIAVTLPRLRATTATLRGLRPGRRYSAAVWVRDTIGRLSPRDATTFVAPAAATSAPAIVTGKITDNHGAPLSGVMIAAQDEVDYGVRASTVTDAQGRYRLRLPAAPYYLSADGSMATGGGSDATGYLGAGRDVTLAGHGTLVYNAVLRPGAALTGRVTDGSGNPLAGIDAEAIPAWNYVAEDLDYNGFSTDFPEQQVTTAPDGSFELKGLYPDAFRTCFDPNDGTSYSADAGFGYSEQCADTPHQLHAGGVVDVGSVALTTTPRGGIAGRITSPSGAGVPGAGVFVALEGRRFPVAYAVTGGAGGYTVDGLKPGTYRICAQTSQTVLSASGLGYVSRCRTSHVTVTAGTVARHTHLVVFPGGALSGVVRTASGAPVAGAAVSIGGGFGFDIGGAVTGADGRWTIEGLRSGRHRVCVDASAVAPVRGYPDGVIGGCFQHGAKAVVRRGRSRIGVDFQLRAGAAVRGTVLRNGQPARVIAVYSSHGAAFAFTGRHGHFVLRGLRPGKQRLCFADGWSTSQYRHTCPDHTLSVRAGQLADFATVSMPPSGSVSVSVTDAAGTALNGVDVAVVRPCHRSLCDRSPLLPGQRFRVAVSWTTYGDGSVTLNDIEPGAYGVCLFGYLAAPSSGATPPAGYVDSCVPGGFGLTVHAGRTRTLHETLQPAGEITGTVTDSAGDPLPDMLLRVSGSAATDVPRNIYTVFDDPTEIGSLTDVHGAYAIRSVAPGDQTVCFAHVDSPSGRRYLPQCYGSDPGTRAGATPVTVAAGHVTTGADIVLHRAGSIAGSVTTTSGATPKNWVVYVFPKGHPNDALVGGPFPNGTYHTPGIDSGSYVVCFTAKGYNAQCYDDVPWSGNFGERLPTDATVVPVSFDTTSTGIDASLTPK